MNAATGTPLELLESLAALTVSDSILESKPVTTQSWRAFTLHVGALNIAFPFMGGFEILPGRDIQTIPWVQKWVRGITNVRGEIYTVVDFAHFLGLPPVSSLRSATLFMLPDTSLQCTLLIDSRVNLKTFSEYLEHVEDIDIPERLKSSVSVSLKEGDEIWTVLDVDSFCHAEEFTNIGLSMRTH